MFSARAGRCLLPRIGALESSGGSSALKILFILNDPPYGTQRSYTALRLAIAPQRRDPAVSSRCS